MKESYSSYSIPLTGRVAGGNDLEFIEAEMSAKYDIPLAVVWYTLNGQKQSTGLRLDLDKQVFIDHFGGDAEKQKTLERAAAEIVKLIGAAPRVAQTLPEMSHERSKWLLLLADNNRDFLITRKEQLERHGYQVITATSPREVQLVLQNQPIALAILDVRLEDDADENDVSGLVLAREVAPSIPKILESGFISVELVREAFKPNALGRPAAVDFVLKQEGVEELLNALQEARE